MNKLVFVLVGLISAAALAQTPSSTPASGASSCEAKAVDKNGKPLSGAAKSSFMKKCEGDNKTAACASKAIDKNGKPLAGAAKSSFMKKCESES
jgi:hypothetical protein